MANCVVCGIDIGDFIDPQKPECRSCFDGEEIPLYKRDFNGRLIEKEIGGKTFKIKDTNQYEAPRICCISCGGSFATVINTSAGPMCKDCDETATQKRIDNLRTAYRSPVSQASSEIGAFVEDIAAHAADTTKMLKENQRRANAPKVGRKAIKFDSNGKPVEVPEPPPADKQLTLKRVIAVAEPDAVKELVKEPEKGIE